jgi:hypothetical protein
MFSYIKTAAFAALAFLAVGAHAQEGEEGASTGAFRTGVPCTPCAAADAASIGRSSDECIVKVKVNFFASETGMFFGKTLSEI